jgi:DHA3 family macrolide efflux protein-like MFS transporter
VSIRAAVVGMARRSPYAPVLAQPQLRRVLPGIALSSIGGGMSPVAVSWLALEIAPRDNRGTWVALAIAANILPGALGALMLGRFLNGRSGSQLAGWDALLRAVLFAVIPLVYLLDELSAGLYVALLAVSSILQAWGKAGRYTMLAELLPREHHLAGNSLVNVMLELSTVFGPLLAALVIARTGAAQVFILVAITYAVLAATYRFAVPPGAAQALVRAGASRSAGLRAIGGDRGLVGLLLLTFGFFACYGPVTVAIPLYVADDLQASAGTLAGFYTAFGIGAVIGAFVAGHLQKWPLLPTTVGIVFGFGLALLPLGLGGPVIVSWVAFGLCGAIWGPFPTTTTTLFQRHADAEHLPQILAARTALTGLAVPLGATLGAPAIAILGAAGAILASSLSLIALGVTAAAFFLLQGTGATPEPSARNDPSRQGG